jgi:hypothetical protein
VARLWRDSSGVSGGGLVSPFFLIGFAGDGSRTAYDSKALQVLMKVKGFVLVGYDQLKMILIESL